MESSIVIPDEQQDNFSYSYSDPLILQANLIYQQSKITELKKQNHQLKSEISQLNIKLSQQINVSELSVLKSEMLRISTFVREAQQSRESVVAKSEQEKQGIKRQLQTYKQKYNQAVSANLRKTKTLDKNEALSTKLEQDNKLLRTENIKHIESLQQMKVQISKLESEKRKLTEQNEMKHKELELARTQLHKLQQQHDKQISDMQKSIYEQYQMIEQYAEKQRQSWNLERKYDVLRESNKDLCVICYEREAILMNENCGHLICCFECSGELEECPICRSQKSKFIRLWRS